MWILLGLVLTLMVAAMLAGAKEGEQIQDKNFRAWQAVAHGLGLSLTGSEEERSIAGALQGVPVRVEYQRQVVQAGKRPGTGETTTFYAGGDGRIPATLVVRKDSALLSLGRSVGRMVSGRDEPPGDELFEDMIEFPGIDAYACAALCHEARRQLASLVEMGGEARDGTLVCEVSSGDVQDPESLAPLLEFFAKLGGLVSVTPGSLHQRLAENASLDPSAAVRLRNLKFLVDPSTRAAREIIAATAVGLLADAHAPVRLLAAQQLGGIGSPTLLALASDPELQPALRVEAALAALSELDMPQRDALLAQLLAEDVPELSSAALVTITEQRLRAHSAWVMKSAESEHELVRAAAALALGVLAPEGAEPALIRLLSDASPEVQRAGAKALGQVGSVAAVEPLLALAEGFGQAELRRAARAAIGQIQTGLSRVEAGAVSLVDSHDLTGAVDIADTPTALRVGEVSLADDAASEPDSQRGEHPARARR